MLKICDNLGINPEFNVLNMRENMKQKQNFETSVLLFR